MSSATARSTRSRVPDAAAPRPTRRPLWRRLSWRAVLAVTAGAFVLVYPVYCVLEAAVTHGIHRRGDLTVVDLQAMSNFDMDQANGSTADIPPAYRGLDGKRVMLAGEMCTPSTADGRVDKFQLVYSITRCCFSGPPKVQHFVKAAVPQGHKVEFAPGVVNVIGTLHVGVEKADGQVNSVYRLDVEKVEP